MGRYVGGLNAFVDGGVSEAAMATSVDVGLASLLLAAGESLTQDEERAMREMEEMAVFASASWVSGHDGCGVEVLSAEWLPVSCPFWLTFSVQNPVSDLPFQRVRNAEGILS